MNKADLEWAIFGLRLLLTAESAPEKAFQQWLEENPVVFESLGYAKHVPHPNLTENGVLLYTPDFLVQRADNDLWEIFEIKTPDAEIIKSQTRRRDFYASLSSYISQCVEYADYFDDSAHRQEFASSSGLSVHRSPARWLVAGRDDGLDHGHVYKLLRDRAHSVQFMTYDGLLKKLEFMRARLFEELENLPGFSIHIMTKLERLGGKANFILDVGIHEDRNRVSVFVDTQDRLCFRVFDCAGEPEFLRLPTGNDSVPYGEWVYLSVELGVGAGFTFMSIDVDGRNACFKRFPGAQMEVPEFFMVVGSDMCGRAHSRLGLAEWYVSSRTLRFEDKYGSFTYMAYNYQSEPETYVDFREHEFLYTKDHPRFPAGGQPVVPSVGRDLHQSVAQQRPSIARNAAKL